VLHRVQRLLFLWCFFGLKKRATEILYLERLEDGKVRLQLSGTKRVTETEKVSRGVGDTWESKKHSGIFDLRSEAKNDAACV
jgi:hypothetical protein